MLQYHIHIGVAPSAKPRYCHARPVLRNISRDKIDKKADERAYQHKTNFPKVPLRWLYQQIWYQIQSKNYQHLQDIPYITPIDDVLKNDSGHD